MFSKKKEVFSPYKPGFHHLRAYNNKVYMLINSKNNAQYWYKCQSLDAKAHISFLVGTSQLISIQYRFPKRKKLFL